MTSQNTQLSPVASFSGFMEKLKPQMGLALPKHLSADRMARLALTAFSTTPALQKCSHQSIAASIMTAVQLGLEPNVNGAGYLIPYGTTCTFVPGWKGLVDLVGRSGRGTVYTGVIFEDQIQGVDWEFFDGSRRELLIKKQSSLIDDTKITHAYAIGWVKDSSMPIIELWSVDKLKNHRNKFNKVGNSYYSFKHWEMYCRKIPLLQVIKYMPCSIELAMAVDVTNVSEGGGNAYIDGGVVFTQDQESNGESNTQNNKPQKEPYTDESFQKNKESWRDMVLSGKKTPDAIIKNVETKAIMTEAQKNEIDSWAHEND